jgi:hypothetical protein
MLVGDVEVRTCVDSPAPEDLRVVSSCFDRRPYVETDDTGGTVYVDHHRTVGDWVRAVVGAGPYWRTRWSRSGRRAAPRNEGQWSPARGALIPRHTALGQPLSLSGRWCGDASVDLPRSGALQRRQPRCS